MTYSRKYLVLGALLVVSGGLICPIRAAEALTCGGQTVDPAYVGTLSNDIMHGTTGPNVMDPVSGNDVVGGNSGNDVICGEGGADNVRGDYYYYGGTWHAPDSGAGNDALYGGVDCDSMNGDAGDDVVRGEQNDDLPPVYGGCQLPPPTYYTGGVRAAEGNDAVHGGSGNDYLVGGSGTDTAYGGTEFDRCDTTIETAYDCEAWV